MRILIIEDDVSQSKALRSELESQSFAIDTAHDGERGSYLARTNDYDLIILDLMLPKKDGCKVCQDIRNAEKHVPILMLSSQSTLEHKVRLLNDGADDYMAKPFSFSELMARIRALLRRPFPIQPIVFEIADLRLDLLKHKVIRAEKEVYLTRKEFALLEYLMRHIGRVISRGMLMEHVWNAESDPFSNTIEAHILNIRKKIDTGKKHKLIHTVPGRGYKIDFAR